MCGTAGTLNGIDELGNVFTGFPAVQGYNRIRLSQVSTGGTAANIWALYGAGPSDQIGGGGTSSLALAPIGPRNEVGGGASGVAQLLNTAIRHRTGRKPVSGFVLRCPWFFVSSVGVETLIGNGCTATASVEYPPGTFTQAFAAVGGTASMTITDGTAPDFNVAVNIPAGTDFFVHWHSDGGVGGKYPLSVVGSSLFADRQDAGSTDRTMVGGETAIAVAAPGGLTSYSPVVLGFIDASEPSYIGVGDSIMAGTHELGGSIYAASVDAYGNLGWFEQLIHGLNGYGYLNMARSNTQAAQWAVANAMNRRLDLCRGLTNSICINALGHNDTGFSAASIQTNVGTVNTRMNGIVKKTVGATITPSTVSTQPVTQLTSSGTIATANVASTSTLSNGESVKIAGASPAAYNVTAAITVVDGANFTYTFAGGTSPATGTITWSDQFATTQNQTITTAVNAQHNANVTSGAISGQTGYIDLMAAFKAGGAAGEVWPANGTAIAYTDDGVHPFALAVTYALTTLQPPL
jgi:hypothetical protein